MNTFLVGLYLKQINFNFKMYTYFDCDFRSQLKHAVKSHGKHARLAQNVFAKKPRRKNANNTVGKCSGAEFVVIMVTETDCTKCLPRNTLWLAGSSRFYTIYLEMYSV